MCDKAVKDREKARRKMKKSRSMYDFVEFMRLKAVTTKVIKAAERRGWRSFCSRLLYRTKLGLVWKVVKRMNNTNTNYNI